MYMDCALEETGSPGMIYIVSHHILYHPSEPATSSIGNLFRGNAHIALPHKLTQSEVTELTNSMFDESVVSILKRHKSQGITIVCSQRKFISHIDVWFRLTELRDITLQISSYEHCNFPISTTHLISLPHVRSCLAHSTWNTTSNLKPQS